MSRNEKNYSIKMCLICGAPFETYRNTGKHCKECIKDIHREYNKCNKYKYVKKFKVKTCVVCNITFTAARGKNISNTCSESCRKERSRVMSCNNSKRYRNKNKDTKEYKDRKKKHEHNYSIDKKCADCGSTNKVKPHDVPKDRDYLCIECFQKSTEKLKSMASRGISKANTSGFIGVYVIKKAWKPSEVWGVWSLLSSNRCLIFRNTYKDPELYEKTFIQAAVDRDIFIIENNLAHTRNFTDNQLLGNMEHLAHIQLDIISKILKDK